MSAVTIAPSKNLQLQSPLVRLPAEIKHLIFGYCFAASGPITDALPGSTRSKAEVLPGLGVNVLRTCRRIYHEADRRQIFAKNTFAFTTAERVRHFFEGLGEEYSGCVQDVEIDARKVNSNHPEIAHEWLQYLAWGSGGWTGETWGKTMGSLRMDAPGLKCLRLNFASWPSIPMSRAVLWNVLRGMISQLERLERVVVVGASEGKDMSRQNPWSPVHFVGGDDVGSEDLVELMWKAVSKPGDHKNVVRWKRHDGKLCLEVVTFEHLVKEVDRDWTGTCVKKEHTNAWPESGSCTWFQYQNRGLDMTEPTRYISPSVAE